MSIINKVFNGSYKGFPILIEGSTADGGPKLSIHRYPNRDTQTIENLGLNPRAYELKIVVNSPSPDQYFSDRDALLRILDLDGAGELVHPYYGRLTNMVALPWQIVEEDFALGLGKLTVRFEASEGTGIPDATQTTSSQIQSDLQNVLSIQTEEFPDDYSVTTSVINNVNSAVDKGSSFINSINESTEFVGEVTAEIDAYSKKINDFTADIYRLIETPANLIDSINGLFSSVSNLFDAPGNILQAFENLFGFGDDDVPLNINSATNNELNQNNAVFNSAINVNALAGAYVAASEIESTTVEQIDEIAAILNAQFEQINSSDDTSVNVKIALNNATVTIQDFFNEQRLIAAELVPIHVTTSPARLISFNFYNDSTRGAEIASINNQPDISFIKGDIQILSD